MLFTSIPSKPNVTSSDLFKERGNNGDIPCPVSDCSIYGVLQRRHFTYTSFRQNIAFHVAANLLKREVDSENEQFVDLANARSPQFIQPPVVGVNFGFRNSQEDTALLMQNMGFTSESLGRANFYRGILPVERIREVVTKGGDLDTYTPYGVTSIRGLLAFTITARLAWGTIQSMVGPAITTTGDARKEWKARIRYVTDADGNNLPESYVAEPITGEHRSIIYSAKPEIKRSGIFMPYYEGLSLPDKNFASGFVAQNYFPVLAASAEKASNMMASIRTGWKSLATTQAGMALTHILFCIDVALQAGARPILVKRGDESYAGMLLQGTNLRIYKNGLLTPEKTKKELIEEVASTDKHASAIAAIANILTAASKEAATEDIEAITYSPQYFQTPRQIHDAIRKTPLTEKATRSIKVELQNLNFQQAFWDPKDAGKIARAIEYIGGNVYPDQSVPIPYKLDVMFTTNIYLSVLSAFGSRAPTISVPGGNAVAIRKVDNKFKWGTMDSFGKGNQSPMPGMPIYVVPLNEAATTWKQLVTMRAVTVKLNTRRQFVGAGRVIPPHRDEAITIARLIGKYFCAPTGGEKRKRVAGDNEEDVQEKVTRATKRLKSDGDDASAMLAVLGITEDLITFPPSDDEEMDED